MHHAAADIVSVFLLQSFAPKTLELRFQATFFQLAVNL